MDVMTGARAAALSATLDALHDSLAGGRSADDDLQVTLLDIAREQAAALSRPALLPASARPAAEAMVIPFRRQAKMSTPSSI